MRWIGWIVVVGALVGCPGDDGVSDAGDGSASAEDGPEPTTSVATGGTSVGSATGGSSTGSPTSSVATGAASSGPCAGEFNCVDIDEATCLADECCQASYGRVYDDSSGDWCLGTEPEYVGCGGLNDACDYVGTLLCGDDVSTPMMYVELDVECFPNGCIVSEPPEADIPDCP